MNIIMKEYTRRFFQTLDIGTPTELLQLVNTATDLNIRNEQGVPALFYVIDKGRHSHLVTLLKNGAEVNIQDDLGNTALHISIKKYMRATDNAAKKNSFDMIASLLKHKADPYIENHKGHTSAYIARINKSRDIISLIYDYS